jgi:muconate cycloisomerase
VEQPLDPGDPGIAEFSREAKGAGITLMADESACSLEDVKSLAMDGYYDMVNIRISKCGGFRRSLKIIDHLRKEGIAFQIGCQLGESGLLSAAGRALGTLCGDAVYYDGSYDKYMLKENITCENVSFGTGGMARALDPPGLGVEVDRDKLEYLSKLSSRVTVKRPG